MALGAPDVRISVFNPSANTCYTRDASADLYGGHVRYEDTPAGCGAGELLLGLHYEEINQRGYWDELNVVEISTGDDTLQKPILAGANKLYVSSTLAYDTAQGEDAQQVYLWDGSTLTMGIPVTGVGSDAGGSFITVGAPLSVFPNNPNSIIAYGAGTIVGRRRYAGVVRRVDMPNDKAPKGTVALGPLSAAFDEAVGGYTVGAAANVDVTTAIETILLQFASEWPHLSISGSHFTSLTGATFSGTRSQVSVGQMIADMMQAIASGDLWVVRVGHDRTPRMIRLYNSSANTYTYNLQLMQGWTAFEPVAVDVQQDAGTVYNRVQVIGNTDPATQQPYSAIVIDSASYSNLGRYIDAQPVTNTSLNSVTACANYGRSLLNQFSTAKTRGTFRVYTRNDVTPVDQAPQGLANGDAVRAVQSVSITGFDGTGTSLNEAPDSEILEYQDWTSQGLTFSAGAAFGGNALTATSGSPSSVSPKERVGQGREFVFSCYLDARYVTGAPQIAAGVNFYDATGAVISQLGLVTQTNGVAGRVASAAFYAPANAVSYAYYFSPTGGALTTSGGSALWARPMLSHGGVDLSYVPNYGAPNPYGICSSVVSTIDFASGDRWQDVQFAPIEPDWNAQAALRNNALAASLQANVAGATSASTYAVSPDAFPPSWSSSSLVLGIPAFNAVFGNSTIVAVAASNQTLPANATTWIWLTSSGSYNLQSSPAPQTGEILYGYATTNGSGIVGFTQRAAIAALKIPMAYLLHGMAFNPSFSATIENEVPGTFSSQLKVVVTCSNQPTDGSMSKARFWYRQSGQPTWSFLHDFPPCDGSGNQTAPNAPSATGKYTVRYPDATNGITYEFGFSLEAGSSAETPIGSCGTITPAATAVPTTSLAAYSGGAPTVYSVSAASRQIGGGLRQTITFTVTVSDFGAKPSSLLAIHAVTRPSPDSNYTDTISVSDKAVDWSSVSYDPVNGRSTFSTRITTLAGESVDLGLYYVGPNGVPTSTTWAGTGYADPDGAFFTPSSGQVLLTRHDTSVQLLQNRNLVRNGMATWPKFNALWSNYGNVASVSHGGTYTNNGYNFTCLQVTSGTGGGNLGQKQIITVKPGRTYSYAGLLYQSASGNTDAIWIGDTAITTQYNGGAAAPSGNIPSLYSGLGSVVGPGGSTVQGAFQVHAGTFTVPSGVTQIALLSYSYGSAPASSALYMIGLALWEGSKWQDYSEGLLDDGTGAVNVSTPFNNQGAFLNVTGTPTFTYTATATSVSISIPSSTYTRTDNSSIPVSAASYTNNSAASSTTYYFDIYYDSVANQFVIVPYGTTAPTNAQQFADCYTDGRINIYTKYSITTPVSGSSGGSGGGGGTISGPSCPAEHQMIPTRARGSVRADELDIGDEIPGPGPGGWVRVTEATRLRAPLWTYTLSDGDREESFDVNDTHALLGADGDWHMVRSLVAGARVRGRDRDLVVADVRPIGDGRYVALEVDGHVYELGAALVHNPITN